ncbi:hypothetical protein E8L90_17850 [Brevibacillus antibioticus]|uniref:Cell wall-active antibiotics response LiaF-like C-terminal domain-containing protein n=1 Tax=Brevibacillus antibioticus TaxID=2570228 RepID=A0A4U2Y964_9BACL|nr:cell wall-active antibiotics response protein LiaF [Brevibacillus antibioticus]TKI57169.1 hypothetical protein E8L90_17850 [Brevibacillus antibioticus]
MKLSRLHKMLAGVLIIFTGIGLLLDSLGIISFGLFDLWPMVLIYFGLRLWGQKKRIGGGILLFLGTIITMDMWFGVGIDDLFQIAVPIVFIFVGFQLIRGKNSSRDHRVNQPLGDKETPSAAETILASDASVPNDVKVSTEEHTWLDSWNKWKQAGGKIPHHERMFSSPDDTLPKDSRSSLIGDYHLTSGRFELNYLHVWHGIGDVVIDLSRAVLVRDEAVLVVEGWVGDVTIYVPVDLPVSVTAGLSIGDLEVLSHRQGGINRSVKIRADQYDEALQKVNLHISLLVGDIKVKYI